MLAVFSTQFYYNYFLFFCKLIGYNKMTLLSRIFIYIKRKLSVAKLFRFNGVDVGGGGGGILIGTPIKDYYYCVAQKLPSAWGI